MKNDAIFDHSCPTSPEDVSNIEELVLVVEEGMVAGNWSG